MVIAMTVKCVWKGVASIDSVVVPWVLAARMIKNASIIRMATVELGATIQTVLVSVCPEIALTQTRYASPDVPQTPSNCRLDVRTPRATLVRLSVLMVSSPARIMGRA